MNIHLETSRLIIRELQPIDAPAMFLMDSDEEVHRYVGQKPVDTIEETQKVIDFIRQQYLDNGIGRWAVIEKGTNEFIGWVGFKLMTEKVNDHINYYDFGYRFTKNKWGMGIATEASIAVMKYGIEILKLKVIFAMTDVDNRASRRVLEKLGFQLKEIFNYDAKPIWRKEQEPTTWYEFAGF